MGVGRCMRRRWSRGGGRWVGRRGVRQVVVVVVRVGELVLRYRAEMWERRREEGREAGMRMLKRRRMWDMCL